VGARIFQISVNKINLGHRRARLLIADLHKINRSRGWTRRGPGGAPAQAPPLEKRRRARDTSCRRMQNWLAQPAQNTVSSATVRRKGNIGVLLAKLPRTPRFHAKCQKAPAHIHSPRVFRVYLSRVIYTAGFKFLKGIV